jgi:glycogen debranching enzyme
VGDHGGKDSAGVAYAVAVGAQRRQPPVHQLVAAVSAPALSLSDDDGQIRAEGAQGFYMDDVRVLSELVVTVNGEEPVPLGHDLMGGGSNSFEAAVFNVGRMTPDPTLFVSRRRRLQPTGMTEALTVLSRARVPLHFRVQLRLSSDLATITAVKSGLRPPARTADADGRHLVWRGPDGSVVEAAGTPDPDLVDSDGGYLGWDIVLAPGEGRLLSLSVRRHGARGAVAVAFCRSAQGGDDDSAPTRSVALSVESQDPRLGRFTARSLADLAGLRMAMSSAPADVFTAAGVPWFLTLFGRDSIWAARMLLPLGSELALGTLRTLARRQGAVVDHLTGEEPGKILHEVRREPASHDAFTGGPHGEAVLFLPPVYFGTVDATPLWVCLLHDAWRWGLADKDVESLLDPMQRCLGWLADYGCGAGPFVSYVDESGRGLTNQGWKDSHDAIQFRDGRVATAPLALCEVQGYAYEAAAGGAELLDAFGHTAADRWREFAAGLAERFRERFWVEDDDGPYPAVALDAHGAPVDSLSSNVGHLLGTGLLDEEEAELVAGRLGGPDMNSGFGLRTLSASSVGFNPLGYHTGSVWAHDTAIAIAGLSRTPGAGAKRAAAGLIEGLLTAAEGFEYRMPELYGGHSNAEQVGPLAYPASCRPQAWAAASAVSVISTLIGVRPDVPGGAVQFAPLPGSGPLLVEGLDVAGATIAVRLTASGSPEVTGLPPGLTVRL